MRAEPGFDFHRTKKLGAAGISLTASPEDASQVEVRLREIALQRDGLLEANASLGGAPNLVEKMSVVVLDLRIIRMEIAGDGIDAS